MSKVFAHRGWSGNYPENTMLAFEKAIELGMHMVVESETLQPDGISEVTRCFNYLKTLEKQQGGSYVNQTVVRSV